MDNDRIAAIAARGEQIKTNSAEYLWICRGVKPPLLPPTPPLPNDVAVSPLQPQPRPLHSGTGQASPCRDGKALKLAK